MISKFYKTYSSKAQFVEKCGRSSLEPLGGASANRIFPELRAKNLFLFIVPLVACSRGLFYIMHKSIAGKIRYRQGHYLLKILF